MVFFFFFASFCSWLPPRHGLHAAGTSCTLAAHTVAALSRSPWLFVISSETRGTRTPGLPCLSSLPDTVQTGSGISHVAVQAHPTGHGVHIPPCRGRSVHVLASMVPRTELHKRRQKESETSQMVGQEVTSGCRHRMALAHDRQVQPGKLPRTTWLRTWPCVSLKKGTDGKSLGASQQGWRAMDGCFL